MKIDKLTVKSYNGEVAAVVESLAKAAQNKSFETDVFFTAILTQIRDMGLQLVSAVKQDLVFSEMDEKDDTRDDRLRAVFFLNKAYLYFPEVEVQAAAEAVQHTLDKYGLSQTIRENYALESTHIASMIEDLAAPEVKANIDKLPGMATCTEALAGAQADFAESYVKYEQEKAKSGKTESAGTVKAKLLKIINGDFIPYLRIMCKAKPETYEELAAETAQIIADNNEKVKKRQKKDWI